MSETNHAVSHEDLPMDLKNVSILNFFKKKIENISSDNFYYFQNYIQKLFSRKNDLKSPEDL